MISVARFSEADQKYLNRVEIHLLRSQTMVPPPRRIDAASRPAAATYVRTLHLVATRHCARAPRHWDDQHVDEDYLEMRLRIVHQLDTTTVNNVLDCDEQECRRRNDVLTRFINEI